MNPPTHPVVYNLEQAAEMLGVTRRWLLEWLWKHPRDGNGTLFYRKAGRTRLFREADIARIVAAQPAPKASPRSRPCWSPPRRRKKTPCTARRARPVPGSARKTRRPTLAAAAMLHESRSTPAGKRLQSEDGAR
jgi:hypothetical protein